MIAPALSPDQFAQVVSVCAWLCFFAGLAGVLFGDVLRMWFRWWDERHIRARYRRLRAIRARRSQVVA